MKVADEENSREGPRHIDLTLGKINKPKDSVDHRIAKGDHRVYAAGRQTVYNLL